MLEVTVEEGNLRVGARGGGEEGGKFLQGENGGEGGGGEEEGGEDGGFGGGGGRHGFGRVRVEEGGCGWHNVSGMGA